MSEFRYSILRYIPNIRRMEPRNIGILLQNENKIDFMIKPQFVVLNDFIKKEINDDVPNLKPDKLSKEFFKHLANLISQMSNYSLTRSLYCSIDSSQSFDCLLKKLYQELVE